MPIWCLIGVPSLVAREQRGQQPALAAPLQSAADAIAALSTPILYLIMGMACAVLPWRCWRRPLGHVAGARQVSGTPHAQGATFNPIIQSVRMRMCAAGGGGPP